MFLFISNKSMGGIINQLNRSTTLKSSLKHIVLSHYTCRQILYQREIKVMS